MREPYSTQTMSSAGGLRVTDMHNSSPYSNRSLRSAVSASTRAGDLVKQAMTYFETDRQAAWRCLSDATRMITSTAAGSSHELG